MKESELRTHADCSICGGKTCSGSPLPLFWTVKLERHALDIGAATRQQGLTMQLGMNAALAQAMGPNEDMTKLVEENEITVCEACAMKPTTLFDLAGIGASDES